MDDQLVSIVIPVHNREETIDRCLESIQNQTYHMLEIIVIDDHSTDLTRDKVQKICQKDNRVKLFLLDDERRGAQAARNEGIRRAIAKWIMFNDSDDEWVETKTEEQFKELDKYKYDEKVIIYTNCIRKDIETGKTEEWKLPNISYENSYIDLLKTPGPMFQGMLVSKKMLEKCEYLNESTISFQEWDTCLRLASENGRFVHLKKNLYIYYVNSFDAISSNPIRGIKGYWSIIMTNKLNILNNCSEVVYKQHLIKLYSKIISYIKDNSNWNEDKEVSLILNECVYYCHDDITLICRPKIFKILKILKKHNVFK